MSTVITLARENIARLTEAPEFSFNWHISQKSRTDPATKEKRLLNKVLIEKRPKQGRAWARSPSLRLETVDWKILLTWSSCCTVLQDAPHLDLKEAPDRSPAQEGCDFRLAALEADYHRHIQQKGLTEAAWGLTKALPPRDLMVLPAGRRPIHGRTWP